jgi:hypothetical protein
MSESVGRGDVTRPGPVGMKCLAYRQSPAATNQACPTTAEVGTLYLQSPAATNPAQ